MTLTTHRTVAAGRPTTVPSSRPGSSQAPIPTQRGTDTDRGTAPATPADEPPTPATPADAPSAPSDDDPSPLGWFRVLSAIGSRAVLVVVSGLLLWAVLPSVIGWESTTVMSGSMQPRIFAGDLVVARSVDPSVLRPDQILLVDDPDHAGKLRLHRFVAWTPDGELVLRGDANDENDSSPVSLADVHGVAVLRIPYVGLPLVWAREHDWARVLAVVAAIGLLSAAARLRHDAPTGSVAAAGAVPALVPTPDPEPIDAPVPTPVATGSAPPAPRRPTSSVAARPAIDGRPAMPRRTFTPRTPAAPTPTTRVIAHHEPSPTRPVMPVRTYTRNAVAAVGRPAASSARPPRTVAGASAVPQHAAAAPAASPHRAELVARPRFSALRRALARLRPTLRLPQSVGLRWGVVATVLLLGVVSAAAPPSRAAWNAFTGSSGAFAADTLASPAGLSATAVCTTPIVGTGDRGSRRRHQDRLLHRPDHDPGRRPPGLRPHVEVQQRPGQVDHPPTGLVTKITTSATDDKGKVSFSTTVYERIATAADAGRTYTWGTPDDAAGGMIIVRNASGMSTQESGDGSKTRQPSASRRRP